MTPDLSGRMVAALGGGAQSRKGDRGGHSLPLGAARWVWRRRRTGRGASFVSLMVQRGKSLGAKQYMRKNMPGVQQFRKSQKLVRYAQADERLRSQLDASILAGCNKWKSFTVAVPVVHDLVNELLSEVIPFVPCSG